MTQERFSSFIDLPTSLYLGANFPHVHGSPGDCLWFNNICCLEAMEVQRQPIRCSIVGNGKGNTQFIVLKIISDKIVTLLKYTIVLKIIQAWSNSRIYLKKNFPY